MNRKLVSLLALVLLGTGCAFTQADLDVHFDAKEARSGPLARVSPSQFQLPAFQDSRIDRERIGHKKNGWGQNTADIKTLRPVPDIVREAVQMTLEKNGHSLSQNGPLAIQGDVVQFWFDLQVNFWTIEFMGTSECKLKVVDAASGASVYEGTYTGHYNEKSAGGYEGSWERVMNLSLARMAESIAMDEKLSKVLGARPVAAAP